MTWIARLCWFLLPALAAGCGSRVDLASPPDIRPGEDACDACKMIISEMRYAAAFYDDDEYPRRFDDIGCLLDALRSGAPTAHPVWLHAYQEGSWLRAGEAVLVQSDAIHTAMGNGIVATGSRAQAEALAEAHNGAVLSWDDLLGHNPEKP